MAAKMPFTPNTYALKRYNLAAFFWMCSIVFCICIVSEEGGFL